MMKKALDIYFVHIEQNNKPHFYPSKIHIFKPFGVFSSVSNLDVAQIIDHETGLYYQLNASIFSMISALSAALPSSS